MSYYPNHHRLALFSLKPLNKQAQKVVNHPLNQHLTSKLPDGTTVLDIGFQIRSRSQRTIATLGRADADIFVEGTAISRLQCSFEIEPTTNVILLYDRSNGQTTQLFGEDAVPFEHGRLRRVVIQKDMNSRMSMGGGSVQFEFIWYQDFAKTTAIIKDRESMTNGCEEDPRLALTADGVESGSPSQMQTRIHTPGPRQLRMRYMKCGRLGAGQFGTVYKALNLDTGRFLAVKIIQKPEDASKDASWKQSLRYALKREVETLSRISHPHIIDFVTSQGWDGPTAEIFMGLKDGTLQSLVLQSEVRTINNFAKSSFHQILMAIHFLAENGIVHRDVKPENILYTMLRSGNSILFQLGDFGLCNRTVDARSSVGTPLYTAPEVYDGVQSHKMDVWSLFVTVAWTLNFDGFRQGLEYFTSIPQARQAVFSMASRIPEIQEMARIDPNERASAAQMLVKCFGGEGLLIQRNRVPPLSPPKPEARAHPELPPTPMPQVKHRPALVE
ncbi:uncharacterized protein N7500_008530 [Penicillium coprophilum]|uniref:uncharacterized protein n=1 Tax=Penicillium coprophilum TaxID=36646 RepID=UPI0023A48384|nr:uncharacterized protein N7500_008530 [Penicillium coprophilum]KAJ5158879.1 hypothetical protein N7500_008530 [Penicillium coprophilum]